MKCTILTILRSTKHFQNLLRDGTLSAISTVKEFLFLVVLIMRKIQKDSFLLDTRYIAQSCIYHDNTDVLELRIKETRQSGTTPLKVGWFENQHHIEHSLMLVEPIRNVLGQKRKKIVGTVFQKPLLKRIDAKLQPNAQHWNIFIRLKEFFSDDFLHITT